MEENGNPIGVFVGLESSSYEYIASIISPYQRSYTPKVGGFMLIDSVDEFLVARIMDYVPKSELTTFMGLKWLSEMALNPEKIGQDIKRRKISYSVKIKLLGRISKRDKKFIPGISKIPHITSRVINPNTEIIKSICNYALEDQEKGMEVGKYFLDREIGIKFDVKQLVGKRTFIFARAGYGKSNLMKVLASNWNREHGALFIFDPEGEYATTDKRGRPGIMDKYPLILITNRKNIERELGGNNIYLKLKLDIASLPPSLIAPILVTESKHDTVFFSKLMSLKQDEWSKIVNIIYDGGWATDRDELVKIIYRFEDDAAHNKENEEMRPILNNLVNPIKKLHDPDSKLLDILKKSAEEGHIVVIDISLLDSHNALKLSSIIVSYFFNENQDRFTGGAEDLYKIVFTLEEAQSIIGKNSSVAKFVELAKEGRKYDLGSIFITQQPGSISSEILSQGDNFFVFHLLSKGDLKALQNANANYSEDILTQILNEPIPGKTYMWTSKQPFVLPVKIINFEEMAEPKQAKKIQSEGNLLEAILSTVDKEYTEMHRIEAKLVKELEKYINEKLETGEDLSTRAEGLIEDIKRNEYTRVGKITIAIYKTLSKEEVALLDKNGKIQRNNTGDSFSIKSPYLKELLEKIIDISDNHLDPM